MGWGTIYNTMIGSLDQQMQTMTRLQESVSSGARINRPSDDPVGAFQIMSLSGQARYLEVYPKNINSVSTDMQQISNSLQQVSDVLIRVKQVLTQAANQTYSVDQVRTIGEEIDSLLEQMVATVNTKSVGHYVFSGSDVAKQPYAVTRQDGRIASVTYQGGSGLLNVPVAPGVQESGVMVGEQVFRATGREAPLFLGTTGAQAGSGTSSVRGDTWLDVIHDTTTYAGSTGIAAGSHSATSDTIIGTGHSLHLNFDDRTVRLDNGAAVAFTGGTTDLKLTNAAGDIVYVDTSNLAAGQTGTADVAITATAKLSIDNGLSTVVSSGGEQAVADQRTGRVLWVDTAGLTRTGSEPVRVPGTNDLFNMLINVRDILLQKHSVTEAQRTNVVNNAISSLDEVMQHVSAQASSVGARTQAMETLKANLDSLQDNTNSQISQVRDSDIAQIAAELARTQTYYQMTLMSASKILNLSLLDYLK